MTKQNTGYLLPGTGTRYSDLRDQSVKECPLSTYICTTMHYLVCFTEGQVQYLPVVCMTHTVEGLQQVRGQRCWCTISHFYTSKRRRNRYSAETPTVVAIQPTRARLFRTT